MNSAAPKIIRETIGEVMTTDVVSLKIDDTLRLADDMMNLVHLRHFPVLDEGKVVGIVNHDDLLHASMASLSSHPQDPPRSALGAVAVREIMKPPTIRPPETSIQNAAELMVEHGIECVLVVQDERLVGLVTRTDLLRELASR
jgi:CBS domain-containing membrane protein